MSVTPDQQKGMQMQQQQPAVMVAQPGQGQYGQNWMPMPQNVAGVPHGLEYLSQVDQLLVHQQVELFEAFTGIEMKNKYAIKNSLGQQVYFVYEESEFCHRIMCGEGRGFTMHVMDNVQQEVMRIVRPFQCCAGCCWCADQDCCGMTLQVEAPPGNVVGHVRQTKSGWYPHYDILDAQKNPVLKIRGPCCICQEVCCTADVDFLVKSNDLQTEVGKISKQWAGCVKESFTKADNFGVSFPGDLDVKVKATLFGAVFLIEFMFFEYQDNSS